jgi:hypothetical protein
MIESPLLKTPIGAMNASQTITHCFENVINLIKPQRPEFLVQLEPLAMSGEIEQENGQKFAVMVKILIEAQAIGWEEVEKFIRLGFDELTAQAFQYMDQQIATRKIHPFILRGHVEFADQMIATLYLGCTPPKRQLSPFNVQ